MIKDKNIEEKNIYEVCNTCKYNMESSKHECAKGKSPNKIGCFKYKTRSNQKRQKRTNKYGFVLIDLIVDIIDVVLDFILDLL